MEAKRFYGCYLLCSLNPRYKGRTYIGFTVNPRRRLRQHNGEITSGAWFTKKRRPWEMVMCIHGFPSQVDALKFEWAGVGGKIKIAYAMLNLSNWRSMKLTVHFFSTMHVKLKKNCPPLPENMQFWIGPMEDLPTYANNFEDEIDEDQVENGDNDDPSPETSDSKPTEENPSVQVPSSIEDDEDAATTSSLSADSSELDILARGPVPAAMKRKKPKKPTKAEVGHDLYPYRDPDVTASMNSRTPKPLPRPPLLQVSPSYPSFSVSSSPRRLCLPSLACSRVVLAEETTIRCFTPEKPGSSMCPFIIISSTPTEVKHREVIDLTDSPQPW